MTQQNRAYVIRVLADRLDLPTPGASTSRTANRVLAREFVEENVELVEAVVVRARGADLDLSPWIIEPELLDAFEQHCRSRIKPATWADRD